MAGGTKVGGRRGGSPRMTLDEGERQWHGPRRRHIAKHADEYSDAFAREVLRRWPACLGGLGELYGMAWSLRRELPSLCRPPFVDEGSMVVPPERPTPEADNRPPLGGDGPGGTVAEKWANGVIWRAEQIADGLVVAVGHRGATLHFGEHVQYMMFIAFNLHLTMWRAGTEQLGAGPDGDYLQERWRGPEVAELKALFAAVAMEEALSYVAVHPDARLLGAAPPEPGMYDHCPPARPTGEPPMDDGSHLLASERGRRRIDPETGRRMIRTMVLTDDAWPHWEWSEDVEGAAGVGPWGPDVSVGTPEEPAQMSPRESMRGHLTRIGRLDLLHKYLPWEGDPPL